MLTPNTRVLHNLRPATVIEQHDGHVLIEFESGERDYVPPSTLVRFKDAPCYSPTGAMGYLRRDGLSIYLDDHGHWFDGFFRASDGGHRCGEIGCQLDIIAPIPPRVAEQATPAQTIVTPCPSCGSASLFVGTGGHLTCSNLDCKQPSVRAAIESRGTLTDEQVVERFNELLKTGRLEAKCREQHWLRSDPCNGWTEWTYRLAPPTTITIPADADEALRDSLAELAREFGREIA